MKDIKEFKKQLQEEIIFVNEKDKALICSGRIKNRYQKYDVDFTKLYARLVKYQIATYGETLNNPQVTINFRYGR